MSILVGGTAAAQTVALLLAPVLTRLYSVADFGFYQAYISTLTIGMVLVSFRYEMASLLPEDEETAVNVQLVGLISTAVTTCIAAVAVGLLWQTAWLHTRLQGSARWVWLFPPALAAGGALQVLTYRVLRDKSFTAVARAKFVQVGTQTASQVAVAPFSWGPSGLVAGDVLGRAVAAGYLLSRVWHSSRARLSLITRQSLVAAAWRYREFPLVSSSAALMNIAGFAVPPLLIGYLYGAKVLGLFALVDRVIGAPTVLVGQAVSQVYMAEGARLLNESPEQLQGLFRRTMWRLFKIGVVPCVLLAVFAPPVFAWVFGEAWRQAGEFARLLVARQVVAFAVWPLSSTLNLLERQRLQFVFDASRVVVTVAAVWVPGRLGMSPEVAIGCYSFAMLIGYTSFAAICSRVLARQADLARSQAGTRAAVAGTA